MELDSGAKHWPIFLKKKEGMSVLCFIDSYKDNEKSVGSIPIFKIDQVKDKSANLLITFEGPTENLISDLNCRGFSNIYFLKDILSYDEFFDFSRPRRFWDVPNGQDILAENRVHIDKLKIMLEDEKSRILLDKIVRFRQKPNYKNYVKPQGQQYFPSDIPVFSGIDELRFVDAGAFRGDTLKALHEVTSERNVKIGTCVCFEPDAGNFLSLVSEASQKKGNIFLYPTAVWSKRELLCFKSIST